MYDIYEELKQIKADIDGRVKHPYLMKFIDVPVIDEQKLLLLYIILKQTKLSSDKIRQTIIAAMLVQIALDTHEHVGLHQVEDDSPFMKQRQLTVLAGDYYSGLYYYLLALVDDIPTIKVLSTAIKEINEHKITVYQREHKNIDELMDSVAMIESLLIQKVALHVNHKELIDFSKQLLLTSRLNQEKRVFKATGFSTVIDGIHIIYEQNRGFSKKVDPKNALILVDNQLLKSVHYIETFLRKYSGTYGFLNDKISAFINNLDIAMEKAVKEG